MIVTVTVQGISQPGAPQMSISAKKRRFLCVGYNSGLTSAENHGNVLELLPIDSPRSGDMILKNPIEKYFFIMEKNDFENFRFSKKVENRFFSIEKSTFSIFLKIKNSKIFFLHDEKIFFDGIFFKVQLLVKENRLEAVPERFQHFKGRKSQEGEKGPFFLHYVSKFVPPLRMVS